MHVFSVVCMEVGGFVVEHALEINTEKLQCCAYNYKLVRSETQKNNHPWPAHSIQLPVHNISPSLCILLNQRNHILLDTNG